MVHSRSVGAPIDLEICPLMPTYNAPSVMFVEGNGTELWDNNGKRYLDFLSGIAVCSLGHSHPVIAEAVAKQALRLQHVSNLYATEHNWDVSRTLDRLIRGGHPEGGEPGQVFFCNSGAEANEAALKLARKWGGGTKHVVVSAMESFHGRTMATLAATGQPDKQRSFAPMPEGYRHVILNDLGGLEAALDETVAAVLLEPIQGEGGVNLLEDGYLAGVREICDDRKILLMMDEVQMGLGRTGEWFGHHHEGVAADVVTMAKALGNGMPIGACWARREVAAAFEPGDHATTFGGQPLATAAARATLQIMEEIDVPALARSAEVNLRSHLEPKSWCADIRGRGLLLAVELSDSVLASRSANKVGAELLDAGLVVGGLSSTSFRLAPALIVTSEEIAEAVSIMDTVIVGSG